MIAGIGIDMVEVDRIAEKIMKENGFKEKLFSEGEIAFCETKKIKAQHYAARFAAKEAFLKATGMGLTLGHNLSHVEVVHDSAGKPEIVLSGIFAQHARQQGWNKIHLSITHVKAMACAVVIVEQ
ncbi:MAG: holo-ACP synthase [Cyclobacteriaceae bacterium]|nr:holo-ACP synthase [Cyclobacteriaceae bacterium]